MTIKSSAHTSPVAASAPTLLDAIGARLLPRASRTLDRRLVTAVKLVVGVLLLTLLAQVRVQVGPVPITGQTLGVLLVGAGYGFGLGLGTISTYLLLGLIGLPIFAGGSAGPAYFAGPTGDYLIGFLAAAALLGLLVRRGWDRTPVSSVGAMVLASLAIYLPGLVWLKLALGLGWAATLGVGLVPFLAGDLIKLLIAAAALPGAWRLVR